MGNTGTLEVMVVPVGGHPYRKVLEADGRGSFLRALQACVGGPIEAAGYIFGDMVCVGFDPETGEDRDITDEEAQRVMERFGSDESIESGGLELIRAMLRRRAVG